MGGGGGRRTKGEEQYSDRVTSKASVFMRSSSAALQHITD